MLPIYTLLAHNKRAKIPISRLPLTFFLRINDFI